MPAHTTHFTLTSFNLSPEKQMLKNTKTPHYSLILNKSMLFKSLLLFVCMTNLQVSFSQSTRVDKKTDDDANQSLVKQYIASKGANLVVFDSSNIKQFWTDNSVSTSKGFINVSLPASLESAPQKIQLANVNESMDCSIEILTENHDVSFSIYDKSMELLSSSAKDDSFLDYDRIFSSFHLEETKDFSFTIKFFSSASPLIKIKAIILSFPENKTRLALSVPPSVRVISPPFPMVSSDNVCVDGDFETALSDKPLDDFKKRLEEQGNSKYLSGEFLFPLKLSLGLDKNNSASPPLMYLSSVNPISGRYSFCIDTTQTSNKAYFAYHRIKKGNYIFRGLIKGLGKEPSSLTIRPYFNDETKKEAVYLETINIKIEPNVFYEFKGCIRSPEINAASFNLYFVGTGYFLLDDINLIPLK